MDVLNQAVRGLSRRALLRALAGVTVAQAWLAAEPDQPERLAWGLEKASGLSVERRYRADAQVLLLGVPLFHREGVGGGSVLWREFDAGGKTRLLEFDGYSLPARASGLNRLGFIREMERVSGHGQECIYFGLMTASTEESVEAARKALHPAAREQPYTAVDGRIADGRTGTAIAHFTAPVSISGAHRTALVELARQALASARIIDAAGTVSENAGSFLQTLAGMLLHPETNEAGYTYSGRLYRIRLARSLDNKATAYFRERRLIPERAKMIRVSGKLRREAGGKETEFRLWVPDTGERPIPLRIEYQAKSYLRLIFEAQADSSVATGR